MPDYHPDTPADCPPDTTLSPADRLKQLQDDLKAKQAQLSKLIKEHDALKSDVEGVAKTVDELDKVKAAYAKALPELNVKKGAAEKYYGQKITMVVAALGPKKEKVDKKIGVVEGKIEGQKENVNNARQAVTTTDKTLTAAQEDLTAKQAKYDEFKNLEKTIGDNLQKLNDLRTNVEKNDDPPKLATMYVFLREMKWVLKGTNVRTKEDFESELLKSWKDLDKAKETARTAKLAAEAAKAKLDTEQALLAALQKSRVDDLVAATAELNNGVGAAAAGS